MTLKVSCFKLSPLIMSPLFCHFSEYVLSYPFNIDEYIFDIRFQDFESLR